MNFSTLSLGYKILIILGGVAVIIGLGQYVHHVIYQSGYDQAIADIKEKADEQASKAQDEIVKTETKYEKIRNEIKSKPEYSAPVSPLVGNAINRLPEPKNRAK